MKKYNIDLDKLEAIVAESDSFTEVTKKLGYDYTNRNIVHNIDRIIKRNNIKSNHFTSVKRLQKWNLVTKDQLIHLIKKHHTIKDILFELDFSINNRNYKILKSLLNKYNINKFDTFKSSKVYLKEKYKKENLEPIIKESRNYSDVLKKLNNTLSGNGRKTIKKYIELYDIDISHFETKKERYRRLGIAHGNLQKKCLEDILVENSTYNNTSNLKKRLYKEGLKQPVCEMCGQDENWNGMKISMILDHINGVNNDNRIENLRIVCPNCNAGLPTHCRGYRQINKKNKLEKKKKEDYINLQIDKRKVERPPYEQLLDEIKKLGYRATGRKYGVSDNAIRKWIKFYETYEN